MKTPSSLTPEEPLVNPYRAWSQLCWWLALASLVTAVGASAAILALATDRALVVIPACLGGAALLSTIISALVYAHYAPMVERHLDAFRRGEYLVRWSYESGEWTRFAEAEWAGKRAEAHVAWIVFAVLGLVVGIVLWLGAGMGPLALIAGGAIGVVVGVLIGWVIRHIGQRAYRRAQQRMGITYLGPESAYFNGTYHCWATWGIALLSVSLHEDQQSVLSLTIGMNSERSYTLRILVPAGREEEARRIVRLLG